MRGAAEALRTNHATVSRRLNSLESSLEARLFDRTRGGLHTTQLGDLLRPRAERIEAEILAGAAVVGGRDPTPSGVVTLGIAPAIGLTSLADDLAQFMTRHREIDLRIVTTRRLSDASGAEADVSLSYAHEVGAGRVGRRVLPCAKAVYCSPDYVNRIRDNGGEGLEWIGWDEAADAGEPDWLQRSPFPKACLRHRVNEALTCCMMAARGLGLTYLPCFLADPQPGLVRAPYQTPVPDRSLWLLVQENLDGTARVRLLVDFLVARIHSRKDAFLAGIAPTA